MKVVTNALLVALFSLIAMSNSFGQITMQDGVFYTCGEKFYDSGDVGGQYNDNENYTLTICPNNADERTSVTFNSFLSEAGFDQLTVYNNNGTTSLMQVIDGGSALPLTVTATNKTGCLTFVWTSNAGIVDNGWDADITCAPCKPVVPLLNSSTPAANGSNIIGVCEGNAVTLSGGMNDDNTGAYNQTQAGSAFYWDMGNGVILPPGIVANYTYPQPGIYYANLMIRDNAGCRNSVLLNQEIHVTGTATFGNTTPDQTICLGEFVDLTGEHQNVRIFNNRIESNPTDYTIDDVAATCAESDIEVNFFTPTSTYAAGVINKVSISMYHGNVDDLVVMLTSPSGKAIKLHERANGIGDELGNYGATTPFNYDFIPSGGFPTWAAEAGNFGSTIPAGSYNSLEPFSGFNGEILNGTWTLAICDVNGNTFNGLLNSWSIDFDNAQFTAQPNFLPTTSVTTPPVWTGPNITSTSGNSARVTPIVTSTYTFTITNNYNCASDTTIDVNVDNPPVAGNDNTDVICGDGDYDLAGYLVGQDNSSNNGFWEASPSNRNFSNDTYLVQSVPADAIGNATFKANGTKTGTYVFWYIQPGGTCDNDTAFISIDVTKKPNTGGTKSITICSNEGDRFLFPILTGTGKDTIGTWTDVDGSGALVDAGDYNASLDVELAGAGVFNFDYTISTPPCADATTRITITIQQEPEAGTDASSTVCNTSNAYNLFQTVTDGDAGGMWFYNLNGTPPGVQDTDFMSGADFSILDPAALKIKYGDGVYEFLYRVGDGAICQYKYATATITISAVPSAGNTITKEFCTTDATVYKLYNLNSADAGGIWTEVPPNAGPPAFNGTDTTFNPSAVNPPLPGDYPVTYVYDHEQEAEGCPKAKSTLSIKVHRQPVAGVGVTEAICEDENLFDMFALLENHPTDGAPHEENGTWQIIPGNAAAQTYFTTGPLGSDWTYDVAGAIADKVNTGINAGNTYKFRYTVASTGTQCTDAIADLTIEISTLHNPGTPTDFIVCGSNAAVNLFQNGTGFPFLTTADNPSTQSGVWSDADYAAIEYSEWLSGAALSNLSAQNTKKEIHELVYTITSNGCDPVFSKVFVTIDKVPYAGENSTVYFCTDETIVPLFDQLDSIEVAPQPGGTWKMTPPTPPCGACGFGGANFAPNQVTCGKNYEFIYTKTSKHGKCVKDEAEVTVFVVCNPDPGGAPAQPVPVCRNSTSVSLFDILTGNPEIGGTWVDVDETNALSNEATGNYLATFNPSLSPPGLGENPVEFQFQYIVNNGVCDPKSTTITINVYKKPYAGDPVAITTCETTCNLNLYAQLGTTLGTPRPGGTWEDMDGSGALGGSNFNPCLAVANNGAGTYRFKYKVNLNVPALAGTNCYSSEAIVTVTIVKTPEAGSNGEIYACISDNNVPLFPVLQINSPPVDGGGVWTGPAGAIQYLSQATGVLNATSLAPGDYTFVYTAKKAPCPQDQAEVLVHVEGIPSSGTDASVTLCVNGPSYQMINGVGGTPYPTGTFTDVPSCNGCISGGYFSPGIAGVGTFPIRYQSESNACVATTYSTLTITVEALGNAGTPSTLVVCQTNTSVPLTPLLGGGSGITSGGVWSSVDPQNAGALFGGKFMNAAIQYGPPPGGFGETPKKFAYTVTPVACPVVSTEVTIIANRLPVAGNDGIGVACITNQQVALGSYINGEDAGGIWTTNSGTLGLTDPTLDATQAGIGIHSFNYTVSKQACPDDVANLQLEVKPENYAGEDGTISVCASQATLDLNTVITNEDFNGVWTGINVTNPLALSDNVFTPPAANPSPPGGWKLQYAANNGACPQDLSIATVHVISVPKTGGNATALICATEPTFTLFDYLGVPFDQNGTWSDVDNSGGLTGTASGSFSPSSAAAASGPGDYRLRYTISNGTCPPVFSTVTIKLRTLADAGDNNAGYVCMTNASYDLAALINAAPGIGTWSVQESASIIQPTAGRYFNGNAPGLIVGTYKFKYKVPADGCPADSAIATVMLVDELKLVDKNDHLIAGPVVKCNVTTRSYTVEFSVLGGAGGNVVTGLPMVQSTFDGLETFTSNAISDQQFYEFTVTDIIDCSPITIKGGKICLDTDQDGIADSEDLDDDNDGIPDVFESAGYSNLIANDDFDTFINYQDPDFCDSAGSTINALGICSLFDTDGDGIINQYDLDSDGDGIFDVTEFVPKGTIWSAGSTNGKVIGFLDLDKNGWHDPVAALGTTSPQVGGFALPVNSDNDSGVNVRRKADYLDTDSDNDGIPDAIEAGPDKKNPVDTDGDEIQDYRDTDSDNDSVQDEYEGRMLGTSATAPRDTDGDGIPDYLELDADNDGILDQVERVTGITLPPVDTDGDGDYDFQDLDSDDDTMPDMVEAGDPLAPGFPANSDNDGIPNYRDVDSDNDGIADIFEAGPNGNIPAQTDADGIPDYLDLDADGDGLYDELEAAIFYGPNETARDANRLFVEIFDTDGDGIFDFRDLDSDDDGISDNIENTRGSGSNYTYYDFDEDGVPDFRDLNSDNDCIPDAVEAGDPTALVFPANSDTDQLPDYLDTDSDDDGISDCDEIGTDPNNPLDSDGDGIPDYRDSDSDNDGIADVVEGDGDCDSDGTPNYRDFGDNCRILVDIPQGFSPNQDEINDRFVIPDLVKYPQNTLKIYNRWGVLVYEKTNYDNTWDGISDNALYGEEELPVGTYFYLLDLGLDQEPIRGYVYLNR